MVSISQSLFNRHLKVETRFLVYFLQKKKIIRALGEICNPSYTNLRSSRRFYNLIPKQAAKKGILQEKRLFFFSFLLLCLNFWGFFLGFPLFRWVLPLPLPIVERLPPHPPWREPWCSSSHWISVDSLHLGTCISFLTFLSVAKAVRGDPVGPHAAVTICPSSLSQAVWQHRWSEGSVWLPIKTPYWRWIYVWSISKHIGLQLII